MIRAIVIEDISTVREHTIELIRQYCPNVSIVADTHSVKSSVAAIIKLQPDLLFLDIDLIDGTAFDIIRQIPNLAANIIFTTAHDEFAIQAFRLSAVDYLLKPIQPEQLIEAVKKVEEKIDCHLLGVKIKSLLKNIDTQNTDENTILLKAKDKVYVVKISDVIRCEADNTYTTFYLADGRDIITSTQLKEYEALLHNKGLFRTHKSHLINLGQVNYVVKNDTLMIVMKDGSKIPLSLRKKEEFFHAIENMKTR